MQLWPNVQCKALEIRIGIRAAAAESALFNLDSVVGQVRVCIFPALWLGATTTRTAFH